MRRCLALLPLVIALPALADVAPVRPVPGGMVVPVESRDVTMLDEKVELFLGRAGYDVTVTYRFRNEGRAQVVEMGFPNREENPPEMTLAAVKDFQALVGDRRLPVIRRAGKTEKTDTRTVINFWECFSVPFAAGEVKTIVNTYRQRYDVDYRQTRRLVEYVLVTGAYWKGTIGRIEVVATPRGLRWDDLEARTAWDARGGKQRFALSASPAGFTRAGEKLSLTLRDVKPTENVVLALPPLLYAPAAEKTLVATGLVSFGATQLFDGDPSTAWSPGGPDDVKGITAWPWLTINLNPQSAATNYYRVVGVAIRNGRAGADFKAWARARELGVYHLGAAAIADIPSRIGASPAGARHVLQDSDGWQVIRFPAVYTPYVALRVRAIYKGTQSDFPCLGEVKVLLE